VSIAVGEDVVVTDHLVRRVGAVDVHYPASGGALAALVIASGRGFADIVEERVRWLAEVAAYRPGDFYRRELPAITAVLSATDRLDLVLIDGYVDLDPAGQPGLGAHLYRQIQIPVVGVAKTAFHTATHAAEVRRGGATRPLYVTAAGIPIDRAAALVTHLAGAHRLPDLTRRADALARAGRPTPP
jgi:deoxyribonuclease V